MHTKSPIAVILLLAFSATACGVLDDAPSDGPLHVHDTATRRQELRPTDPSDQFGYDGASAQSIVSPGGDFRVWWVSEGEHAVPAADADSSGVPDYVEMVAQVADEVADALHQSGWKLAMSDDPGGGATPPGGDGLFDIYLVDFANGDGHFTPDWCTTNADGVEQCAGHFRLENDFAGMNYPSPEYAAKLVLSHEYFHAVQAAYYRDLPAWWSEGSATWFEEYFDASQDDFERLTTPYFNEPERSLNDRNRGPSDAHAYGASIFVYFLEQHIGADGLRKIFERLARGEGLIDAIDAELREQWVPLGEAFDLFATYNLFTGSRAVADNGYPDADRLPSVHAEPQTITGALDWNLDADPLGARYVRLNFDHELSLKVAALDGFDGPPEFIAVNKDEFEASGAMHMVTSEDATRFDASMSPLYVIVANGHTDARRAATLQIRLPDPNDGGDTGGDTGQDVDVHADDGCSTTGGATPPATLFFLAAFGLLRRRRR